MAITTWEANSLHICTDRTSRCAGDRCAVLFTIRSRREQNCSGAAGSNCRPLRTHLDSMVQSNTNSGGDGFRDFAMTGLNGPGTRRCTTIALQRSSLSGPANSTRSEVSFGAPVTQRDRLQTNFSSNFSSRWGHTVRTHSDPPRSREMSFVAACSLHLRRMAQVPAAIGSKRGNQFPGAAAPSLLSALQPTHSSQIGHWMVVCAMFLPRRRVKIKKC